MVRGLFLSLEGGENSGKTTQADLLAKHLTSRGAQVVHVREPGGTEVGEQLRQILLDPRNEQMAPEVEVLLYAASRSQLVRTVIGPAVERGCAVISDRYIDSSIAYQGYGLGLDLDWIRDINCWATGGLMPDLTILLLGSACGVCEPGDRIEGRPATYHDRVAQGYRDLASDDPERFLVIDGALAVDHVHRQITARVDALLAAPRIGGQT